MVAGLRREGFALYDGVGEDPVMVRMVTAFNSRTEDIDRLLGVIGRLKSA